MARIVVFGLSDLDDGGAVNTTNLAFHRFPLFFLGRVAATPESEQTKKSFPSWLVLVWFMRPCLGHLSCDAYDAIFRCCSHSFRKQHGLTRFFSSCLVHPADAMAMCSCLACCGISSMSIGSVNGRLKERTSATGGHVQPQGAPPA